MPAPRFVLDDFWPSDLFLGGIPGAWYDPTDLSTMFQDSTGTTPVTAVEQPVGLILDKSQGLALGADVVTNGDFSSGASWVLEPGWAIGAGLATKTAGVAASIYQPAPAMVQGRTYLVTFTVSGYTAGILYPVCRGTLGTGVTANGTYTQALIAGAYAARAVEFFANATFAGSLDNVTVRELAGNHASQSTAASRPTYRARYNLLTFSEQFDNAAWTAGKTAGTTVTPNTDIAPDGTLTADTVAFATNADYLIQQITGYSAVVGNSVTFSIYAKTQTQIIVFGGASPAGTDVYSVTAAANGFWRQTLRRTFTVTATGTLQMIPSSSIAGAGSYVLWGAQLLTAADVTATGNAYQRIAAATVYDTAPIFRPYLAFDGLDDSLSTAAINFTSTDKMTVFAGVTKSSGAALGMVTELGNRNIVQAGSFSLTAPRNAGAPDYSFIVEGTAVTDNTIVTYIAPITNVMTARGDIAAPLNQLRVNGAVAGTLTTTLGTGNFGNWPLFIGRRNNTNLPFNGRLFSLIVRGAASSATEIADTELWVNQRTGGY